MEGNVVTDQVLPGRENRSCKQKCSTMKGKYSNLPLLESNRRGQDRTDGMRKVGKWEIIKKPKSEDDTVKLAE